LINNFIVNIKKYIYLISTLFILLLILTYKLSGEVYLMKKEALELAFPDADKIDKKSVFLNDNQINKLQKLSKSKINSRVILFHIGKKGDEILGYAVVDTHIVRSKSQTILVVLNPEGKLKYVEILAFFEPPEDKPTPVWLDLFKGKGGNDNIRVGYDLPNISGATISSNKTAEAIRKVITIFNYFIKGNIKD